MKYFLTTLIFIFFISCEWRTPSRERFSDYCDIKIPENVEVIKDDYHDRIQDNAITYEIRLPEKEFNLLVKSIESSVYFNEDVAVNEKMKPVIYKFAKDMKAIWYKTENGFEFHNDESRTVIHAKVDNRKLTARFEEWYD